MTTTTTRYDDYAREFDRLNENRRPGEPFATSARLERLKAALYRQFHACYLRLEVTE